MYDLPFIGMKSEALSWSAKALNARNLRSSTKVIQDFMFESKEESQPLAFISANNWHICGRGTPVITAKVGVMTQPTVAIWRAETPIEFWRLLVFSLWWRAQKTVLLPYDVSVKHCRCRDADVVSINHSDAVSVRLGSISEWADKLVIMNHFHSYVIGGIVRRVIVLKKERRGLQDDECWQGAAVFMCARGKNHTKYTITHLHWLEIYCAHLS